MQQVKRLLFGRPTAQRVHKRKKPAPFNKYTSLHPSSINSYRHLVICMIIDHKLAFQPNREASIASFSLQKLQIPDLSVGLYHLCKCFIELVKTFSISV